MPVNDPEPRVIEIRSDNTIKGTAGNKLLFKYFPSKMEIEIKDRGVLYTIKLHDLLALAEKSQLDVFYVSEFQNDQN